VTTLGGTRKLARSLTLAWLESTYCSSVTVRSKTFWLCALQDTDSAPRTLRAGAILGQVVRGHGEVHLHLKMGGGFPTHRGAAGLSYADGSPPRAIYKGTMRVRMCDHVPDQHGDERWLIAPGAVCTCPFGSRAPTGEYGQLTNCLTCQFYKWSNGLVPDNRV
jgi:hypothetical protein